MDSSSILKAPHQNFENVKRIDENGIEYWEARELMPLLGYSKWDNFDKIVIEKAKSACRNSDQAVKNHFADIGKMIKIATGTARETTRFVKDYKLSRYACVEKYMQDALVSCPTVVPSATPTPCVCIEAWGAGGFMGLCSTAPSYCKILYSCLLPDGQRYGVWNDEQTVCLEQYVRNKGEWP